MYVAVRLLGVLSIAICLMIGVPRAAAAHGGVRLATDSPAGPYRITVQASPGPLRTATTDVSVLVTDRDRAEVTNAHVTLQAASSASSTRLAHPVTQTDAGKGVYHTRLRFPESGAWMLILVVDGPNGRGEATVDVRVQAAVFGATAGELFTYLGLPAIGIAGLKVIFALKRKPEAAGKADTVEVPDGQ